MSKAEVNCNYILFAKLPWPGDSERTFRPWSQTVATYPPVYHTQWRLHECQAEKLRIGFKFEMCL